MDTHEQRLAAYLKRTHDQYDAAAQQEMTVAAVAWDARLAAMEEQERQSYGDKMDMLSSAVAEKFCDDDDDYSWVVDFDDDSVVFCQNGEKFQTPYSLDGDTVKLGKATPVRVQTTYVPMESNSANPATPKRAFSSLTEWAPAHSGEIQVRLDAGDDANIAYFVGYASTTGVPYEVRDWLGEYTETILPGAFAKTLREQGDIPLLFNHDGVPLASTGSGTSRLSEDGMGLRNEAEFDRRDALSNSVCVQLQRKVLGKMSFSFRAVKDTWNANYDDRGVSEAAVYDSSIVTYPANPTTTGELVDAMRSALGREGRSLWLAEHELSVRSALPGLVAHHETDADTEDLLEKALRALVQADDVLIKRHGPHGRARTFLIARSMMELRAGKVLSTANQKLMEDALSALSSADQSHQQTAAAHATARDAVQTALDNAAGTNADGTAGNQGSGTGGDPANPQDGGGPRSANPALLARQREQELREIRKRR